MSSILDSLAKGGCLLADGAMGTELMRTGLEPGELGEFWNAEKPDAVRAVHLAYVEAGARLLTTNSFRCSRPALLAHNAAHRLEELNRQAAALACEAAAGRAWVLGSIGPSGSLLSPLGEIAEEEAYSWFREQAEALLSGGADGIVIETMTSQEEAELAIRAARDAGAPAVAALMAFGAGKAGYRTIMGVSPARAASALAKAGADIVGANCGDRLEIPDYIEIVRQLCAATSCPVVVRPNAGRPDLRENGVVYEETPERMAAQVPRLAEAGARIIGGCCGTTPEHIRHFGRALG